MSLVSIARRPSVLSSTASHANDANQPASPGERQYSFSDNDVNSTPCRDVFSPESLPNIERSASNNNNDKTPTTAFSFDTITNNHDNIASLGSTVEGVTTNQDISNSENSSSNNEKKSAASLPSANYYTIKGAAVFLHSQSQSSVPVRPKTPVARHDSAFSDAFFPRPVSRQFSIDFSYFTPPSSPALVHRASIVNPKAAAEIRRHLGLMLDRLRDDDQMMMAARLESNSQTRGRYLTLVCYSPENSQSTIENSEINNDGEPFDCALLGFDVTVVQPVALPKEDEENEGSDEEEGDEDDVEDELEERVTLGLAIPVRAATKIRLTGDGGFLTQLNDRSYSFKPVAVQVMWACLHSITEAVSRAGHGIVRSASQPSSVWLDYYIGNVDSDQLAVADWQATDEIISKLPLESESTIEIQIRDELRQLMSSIDLEEASSRTIRTSLEEAMGVDLSSYRQFIDEEMLVLLGQLDLPSEIYEYLYLGSEWNASDCRVLTRLGITHVVNVSREIDNFFPSHFRYFNVRVYDDESTELLRYWDSIYKFIEAARASDGRIFVHCKMGVSRSAACVIAYCMKEFGHSRDDALEYVRSRRTCVRPNKGFMDQLQVYGGILKASRVRHSDIFRKDGNFLSPPSKQQLRPLSYHEEEAHQNDFDDKLFRHTCPANSLSTRIAAFERSLRGASMNGHQHGLTLQERRLRNRTSPAFPNGMIVHDHHETSSRDAKSNFRRPNLPYVNAVTGSKEDVSSSAANDDDDGDRIYPESGHVRRITAQLLTPRSSQQIVSAAGTSETVPGVVKKLSFNNNNNKMFSSNGIRNSSSNDGNADHPQPVFRREAVS